MPLGWIAWRQNPPHGSDYAHVWCNVIAQRGVIDLQRTSRNEPIHDMGLMLLVARRRYSNRQPSRTPLIASQLSAAIAWTRASFFQSQRNTLTHRDIMNNKRHTGYCENRDSNPVLQSARRVCFFFFSQRTCTTQATALLEPWTLEAWFPECMSRSGVTR